MDYQLLISAGVDYDGGLRRFSGNVDMYKRVLKMVLTDTNFNALEAALGAADAAASFAAAHALTGIAGNLSLDRLYQSLRPLVEMLRASNLEGADELFSTVSESYRETIAAISSFLD